MTAEDLSYPFRSSTAAVIVNVIRNNQAPTFTFSNNNRYDVTISEGKPVLEAILTVSAVDSDEGRNGEVTYSITNDIINNNAYTIFGIDHLSGEIYTRVSLLQVTENVYTVSFTLVHTRKLVHFDNFTLMKCLICIDFPL